MKRRKNTFIIILLGIVVGAGLYTSIQNAQQAQACGSAQGEIVSGPTISAQTVHSAFMNQSGAAAELQSMGTANYIVNQSSQYQIDDAFAMADWREESSYGSGGVAAQDENIGNITISIPFNPSSPNRPVIGYTPVGGPIYQLLPDDYTKYVDKEYAGTPAGFIYVSSSGLLFPVYQTWQDGIHGWFVRVKSYVDNHRITDYLSFALYYVDGLLPTTENLQNPPSNIMDYVYGKENPTGKREGGLVNYVTALRQQNGGGSSSSTSSLQIPGGAWATPAARRDAQKLGLFSCTDTHSLVGAGMNLALHLQFRPCPGNWCGLFNVWDSSTPQPPAETLGGVVQCVSFVDSVYRMATGESVPAAPNAGTWWQDYYLDGTEPGFKGIPVASGPPQPGDFIVYWDWDASTQSYQPPHLVNGNWVDFGHIAVIVGVQLPQGGADGFIIVAQGNSTNVLVEQSLSSNGSTWSVGQYDTAQQAQGYIRVTSH